MRARPASVLDTGSRFHESRGNASRLRTDAVARSEDSTSEGESIMSKIASHIVRRTIAAGAMLAAFAFPLVVATAQSDQSVDTSHASLTLPNEIGRASGRERVKIS